MSANSYSAVCIAISSFEGNCISLLLFPAIITVKPCVALFDSGSTSLVLGERFTDSIPHVILTKPLVPLSASVADQCKVDISHMAAQLHIVAGPTSDYYDCIVAPVRYDIIVGVPWMMCNDANVNWDQRLLWTHFSAIPEFVPASQNKGRGPEEPEIACIDVSPRDKLWEHAEALYDLQVAIVINSVEVQDSLVPSMPVHPLATKFAELYKDRLRDELPDELPPQRLQYPRLELRQEAELTNHAVYRMSAEEQVGLRKVLDQLLARDQIYECDAAFASPAFVVKKKQGGYQLLVDMWQLNAAIKDFSWPLPHIGDLLDCSQGCRFFLVFDMVSGYHQMHIHPESEPLMAFHCPLGVYAWCTLC